MKGWYNQNWRHSLAARGIVTSSKRPYITVKYFDPKGNNVDDHHKDSNKSYITVKHFDPINDVDDNILKEGQTLFDSNIDDNGILHISPIPGSGDFESELFGRNIRRRIIYDDDMVLEDE